MEEKTAKIKRELRQLRKITHSIEVSLRVKERHERRLDLLRAAGQTEETEAEIRKIEAVLSSLRIEELIKRATTLESLYMDAISKLEPLDRTIILDGYINGKPYWMIGREIGYSVDGIKKRVGKIIEKIANLL